MKQNTTCNWRQIFSATLLSTGLYGCSAESPSTTPELGAATVSASFESISTGGSQVISTAYAAGTTINAAASSEDIAAAQAATTGKAPVNVTEMKSPVAQNPLLTVPGNADDDLDASQLPAEPDSVVVTDTSNHPDSGAAAEPPSKSVDTPQPEAKIETTPALVAKPEPEPEPQPEPAAVSADEKTGSETTSAEHELVTGSGSIVNSRTITIGERAGDVIKILDDLTVSTSQLMVQQTPVDTQHGYVYTANIEHGDNGDVNGTNLHTVVRKGIQNSDGSWNWTSALVEDRTVHNQWHTAPSVVADKDGYVHVAYNLHNFPWQYKRTTQPHDLGNFDFLGQSITQAEIDRSKFENKTSFPTLGYGQIPGNQITYPAFYKDRNRDVYATYRFAAKPKRSFPDRTMSGGIASYDTQLKSWRAIGGQVSVNQGVDFTVHSGAPTAPTSLASDTGWTVYHPRLMFGAANDLHVNWFFRQGIAGAELTRPCYVMSQDSYSFKDASGKNVSLPMNSSDCGNVGYPDSQSFYSVGNSAMNSGGKPHIVLSPIGDSRQIVSYDSANLRWERENSPNNATEIFFDGDDNLWAIATGIRIMVKLNGSSTWDTVYSDPEGGACFPKVTVNESGDTAFIHTHACDQKSITIYGVRLN